MPLSPPADREEIHDRYVTCRGFRRTDGLWDIEGRLLDTKTYGFSNRDRGRIEAGAPLHQMVCRLTLDDGMVIRAAEASIDHAPYHLCPHAAGAVARLVGVTVGPGFRGRVARALGGAESCTHLRALLDPMARTAWQTIVPRLARERGHSPHADAGGERPAMIDSCHAWRADGPVVQREYPEWYEGE